MNIDEPTDSLRDANPVVTNYYDASLLNEQLGRVTSIAVPRGRTIRPARVMSVSVFASSAAAIVAVAVLVWPGSLLVQHSNTGQPAVFHTLELKQGESEALPGVHYSSAAIPIIGDLASANLSPTYGPVPPDVQLVVSPSLTTSATPKGVPAVSFIAPSNAGATTLDIAKYFGVSGSLLSPHVGAFAVVNSATGRVDAGNQGGTYEWGYSVNPADGNCANYPPASPTYRATCVPITAPVAPSVPASGELPSRGAAIAGAREIARATAPGLRFGQPLVDTDKSQIDVVLPVVVDDVSTNYLVTATYGLGGSLVGAGGVVGALGVRENYPLASPLTAATDLAKANNAALPTIKGSFQRLVLQVSSYQLDSVKLANGSIWLLPVYYFAANDSPLSRQFPILAIQRRYLHIEPRKH
jgi:hypothetical protein